MLGGFSGKQFLGGIFFLIVLVFAYYGPYSSAKRKSPPAYLVGENANPKFKRKGQATLIAENGHVLRRWPVPFSVHSVIHNNSSSWQILALEKNGRSFSSIDTRERLQPSATQAPEDVLLTGHGTYSSDGTQFYLAANTKNSEGVVLAYDSTSLNLLARWMTGFHNAHDLQLDKKNPHQIVVIHSGNTSGHLQWISSESGKQTQEISLPQGFSSTNHFVQFSESEILILGQGLAILDTVSGKIRLAEGSAANIGAIENAYVDILSDKIWVTIPSQDSVRVLDQNNLNLIKEFKVENPGSLLAMTPTRPEMLFVSAFLVGEDLGLQKAYNLKNQSGSDIGIEDPRRFYAEHATPLEVSLLEY